MSTEFCRVIRFAELPAKRPHCATVDGVPVAICRVGDEVFAVHNQCTHALATFDDGRLRGHRLICPLHGAMFDLRTGKPNGQLAKTALPVFETRVSDDGFVEVRVSAAAQDAAGLGA